MLRAYLTHQLTATRRIVINAGCLLTLFFAALVLSIHGRLQTPRIIVSRPGVSVFSGQMQPQLVADYGELPLSFEVNQGQADARVRFLARGRGYGLFLTGGEAVLELQRTSVVRCPLSVARTGTFGVRSARNSTTLRGGTTADHGPRTESRYEKRKSKIENEFVRLRLVGAKPDAEVIGRDELPGKVNYFIGNDPKKWRTNVPTYAKVRYQNIYPGVDLEYYGNQGGQLEYDFVVAPGADPSAIALQVGAVREPPRRIDGNGDLVIEAKGGEIQFHRPLIYQPAGNSSLVTRHSSLIDGHFILDAQNRLHFGVGPYDHARPLVIDPVLTYSTYLGGSSGDWGYGIAVDATGNAYVTGETASLDFPTADALQASNKSGSLGTVFVAKLNPAGSALVYSTFLGGSDGDTGYGIAVDSSNNAYVAGSTQSTDFPIVNGLQSSNLSSPAGGTGFIAKLNASGSALVYSTYLGGSVADAVRSIAVDSSGNAHVTGYTLSTDFPVTSGAFQTTGPAAWCSALTNPSPCDDAFVAELNASGTALVYSTYLGGSDYNAGFGIAVDSSGSAYVAGTTSSPDFPTAEPFQATLNGSDNAFVTKLNASGSELVYSTFLGGSIYDEGLAIAVDTSGSAYVTGQTSSTDFPVVNPAEPRRAPMGHGTGYVAKLNPAGSGFVYSTYLGGSVAETAFGIAVDSSGNTYVVGITLSPDFPTVDPIQSANRATGGPLLMPYTTFAAELNAAGSALVYSTYLGGSVQDTASAVAVDSFGNAYITGNTFSLDFPTVNPLQPTNNNALPPGPTAFVAKVSPGPAPAASYYPAALEFGSVLENTTSQQMTATLTNLGNASLNISGITASGDFTLVTGATTCFYTDTTVAPEANCMVAVTFTPTALGFRTGAITVTAASGGPWALQLTGTGAVSAANISPGSLGFNYQTVGTTSSTQAVTLTNTASVAMAVSSVTVPSGWTQTNNCVPSVGPSASCTINVSFQPTMAGWYYASLLTVTDDAVNSPQTVQLGGTGMGGQASLSPASLTFGDQPVSSTSIAQTIMLVNPNNGSTGVPGFSISGDFQAQNVCDSETNLVTDTPCPISVTFTPTAGGTRTGTLTVTYTSPTPLTLTASLTGTGVAPEASVSPTSLAFGNQALSSASSPMAITLSNTGSPPLSIYSFAMSGDFSETNTCGTGIAGNSSCTIDVVFAPTASGAQTGTLTITDNSNYVPGGTTQTINLSGTGVGPVLSLSATSLTFAAQTVSTQSPAQTITLTNTGSGPLTPLKITRNGDFAQTNTCGDSVAAGASCTISVTFSPNGAGSQSGALTLTDNAAHSPQTVELSGTGMDFAMSSSAPSQSVSAGQTANYSLTLAPESGFNQAVNLTCTGAPSESSCTLTPNSLTLNGRVSPTVAVAVSTTAPALASPQVRFLPPGTTGLGRVFWPFALSWLASVLVLAGARKRRAAWLLGAGLLLVMLWGACGGGSTVVPPPINPGTPAGTYTIDVTATDATVSTLTHTFQFTLTVD